MGKIAIFLADGHEEIEARVFNSSKIRKMPTGRIKPVFFCQISRSIVL